jgi:hypothetical protein
MTERRATLAENIKAPNLRLGLCVGPRQKRSLYISECFTSGFSFDMVRKDLNRREVNEIVEGQITRGT